MPKGQRTSLPKAAQVKALSETGHYRMEIAKMTGVGARTVSDILAGRNGWDDIMKNDPRFNTYRMESKRALQTGSVELAKKALKQIEKKLPLASAAQSAVIFGVLQDKERLMAGESTQNISHIYHHGADSLDSLAEKLSSALLNRQRTKAAKAG